MENEKFISYVTLSNIKANSIKDNISKYMISSVNYLYLKNKILYIYIISDYSTKEDFTWLSDKTVQWINKIILSNY